MEREAFVGACEWLAGRLPSEWSWRDAPAHPVLAGASRGGGYLRSRRVAVSRRGGEPAVVAEVVFHVVFSEAYGAPALLAEPYGTGGEAMRADEYVAKACGEAASRPHPAGPAVTQAAHPVLGVPMLGLHPCRTQALLDEVGAAPGPAALLAWLSTAAPVLGLSLPLARYGPLAAELRKAAAAPNQ